MIGLYFLFVVSNWLVFELILCILLLLFGKFFYVWVMEIIFGCSLGVVFVILRICLCLLVIWIILFDWIFNVFMLLGFI